MTDNSQHAKRRTLGASFMLVSGLIHLILALPHLQQARGAGLFFLILATGQIVWAVMMLQHRTKRLEKTGIVALAIAPSILYVVTRLWRAPFAPGPEPADIMGAMSVMLQLGAVAAIWITAPKQHGQNASRYVAAGLALALVAYGGAIAVEGIDLFGEPEGPHGHDDPMSEEMVAPTAQSQESEPAHGDEEAPAHGH